MTFGAVHQEWGTVFAHLPDLGCGRIWTEAWKARPLAPIVCERVKPGGTSSDGRDAYEARPFHVPVEPVGRQ